CRWYPALAGRCRRAAAGAGRGRTSAGWSAAAPGWTGAPGGPAASAPGPAWRPGAGPAAAARRASPRRYRPRAGPPPGPGPPAGSRPGRCVPGSPPGTRQAAAHRRPACRRTVRSRQPGRLRASSGSCRASGNAGVVLQQQVLELEDATEGLQRCLRGRSLDELAQAGLVAFQYFAGGAVVLALQRLAQGGQVMQEQGKAGGGHQPAPAPAYAWTAREEWRWARISSSSCCWRARISSTTCWWRPYRACTRPPKATASAPSIAQNSRTPWS